MNSGDGIVGRIFGNLGRLLGGKVAAGLISLVYIAIAARTLGPADYGVLVLVHGYAMTVGGLIGFPGWHAVVRYGAQAIASGDDARLARLLRFAALVEGAGALAAIAAAALLAPIVGPRLGWSPTAIAFALPYSLAVLASMRATPAGYLQLTGRYDLLGMHTAVAPLVRLAGAILVAVFGGGLLGFLIAWLTAAIAECAVMWIFGAMVAGRRLAPGKLAGGIRGAVRENPGVWRFMIAANADITLSELSGRVAPLMVGWILGPAAAGLYGVAQRATTVVSQPAQVLGQAAYAELVRLAVSGERHGQLRMALIRCVGIAMLGAVPVLALVALFGPRIATFLGGTAFVGAAGLMFWLAAARTLALVGPPVSAALTALGRPVRSVAANLISSAVLLTLLPFMLRTWGADGAGLNAVLQATLAGVLLVGFLLRETRERSTPTT